MQNNRDSSIWRNLAIAFGNGLAFGVAMKLTQSGGRSTEAPASDPAPPVDTAPLLERLEAMEERIVKAERTPAPIPGAVPPPNAAPFDQKVLEAIVNALDARLLEQAGQTERRITELEAKLVIELKSLQQQDHTVVSGVQTHIEQLNAQFNEQLAAIRRRSDEERIAIQKVSGVQTHIEELNAQFNDQLAAIRRRSDEERIALQKEISSMHHEFAVEAAQAMEERVAELRREIAARDSQIADMQTRLDASDESLRNVVVAIAQACQTVAGRSAPAPKPEPENVPMPSFEPPLPGFAQPKPGPRPMPFPLVSSLALVSAAGLAMSLAVLHYLQ